MKPTKSGVAWAIEGNGPVASGKAEAEEDTEEYPDVSRAREAKQAARDDEVAKDSEAAGEEEA